MQTFLPYPNFTQSAQCLDNKRLGKQRVEAWQIYLALQPGSTSNWRKHPIVGMWRGREVALLMYGVEMCDEWMRRGFNDSLREKFMAEMPRHMKGYQLPEWIGDERFHASHRSNLLRKDWEWYSKFGWREKKNLPYVWIRRGEVESGDS